MKVLAESGLELLSWSSNIGVAEAVLWHCVWRPKHENEVFSCGGRVVTKYSFQENTLTPVYEIPTRTKHERSIRRIAFDPSGQFLACASFDKKVSLWQAVGEHEWVFRGYAEGHESEVKDVAFFPLASPTNLTIATCGRDHCVWVFEQVKEAADETSVDFFCRSMLMNHSQDVKSVIFHPRKPLLVSTSYDSTVKIYKLDDDQDDWKMVQNLEDSTKTVWDSSFTSDGSLLGVCSADGGLTFYRESMGSISASDLLLPRRGVLGSALHVSQATKHKIEWVVDSEVELEEEVRRQPLYSLSLTTLTDGTHLVAVGCGDRSIRVFKRHRPQPWQSVAVIEDAHKGDVNCVRFLPDTDTLASCGDDGKLKLWKVFDEPAQTQIA